MVFKRTFNSSTLKKKHKYEQHQVIQSNLRRSKCRSSFVVQDAADAVADAVAEDDDDDVTGYVKNFPPMGYKKVCPIERHHQSNVGCSNDNKIISTSYKMKVKSFVVRGTIW